MRIGRRGLLLGGAASALVATLAASPLLLLRRKPEEVVASIVKDIFGAEVMAKDQLNIFAAEYVQRHWHEGGPRYRFIDRSAPYLTGLYGDLGQHEADARIHFQYIDVATAMLRATNYGLRAGDEPVTFTGFPDLAIPMSCTNPFARFDFED